MLNKSVFKRDVAQETSQCSFRFLDLPTEIRIAIYKLFLYRTFEILLNRRSRANSPLPETNLLLVNKTIYAEATPLFYQVNKFWLIYSFDPIWDPVGPMACANIKRLEVGQWTIRWTKHAWNMNLHAFTKLEYLDLCTMPRRIFTDFISCLTSKVTLLSASTIIVIEVQVYPHNHGSRFGLSSTDNDDIRSGIVDSLILPAVKQIRLRTVLQKTECLDLEKLAFDQFLLSKDVETRCGRVFKFSLSAKPCTEHVELGH